MGHSIIAPSSAGIWGKPGGCTGYPTMAAKYPETKSSEAAERGTAAHILGAKMIEARSRGVSNSPTMAETVGTLSSNNVVYDEEMYEGAELYADDVAEEMRNRRIFGGGDLQIEERVHASRIHALSEGTSDCFIYDRRNKELIIWDAKFGHVYVEAFENWQGINYAAGIFEYYGIDGLEDQELTVRIRIVQPFAYGRGGAVREWVIIGSDLRPYFNQLHAAAHESLGDNPVCRTGPQCGNCSARHACEAALTSGTQYLEATSQAVPIELSNAALSAQMYLVERAYEQIKSLKTGYEAQIEGIVQGGGVVPGYGATPTVGRQKWSKPIGQIIALGDVLNKDLRKDGVVTPKQALKLGIDTAVITAYSEQSSTGVKITRISETQVRKVFQK